MTGVATWLLIAFLITPQAPEGGISMSTTVMGVSRTYESQESCHRGAGQLQRKLQATAKEQSARVAMACVAGWVYEPK